MTFPALLPEPLRSPFHSNMIVVIGTTRLFLTGIVVTSVRHRVKNPGGRKS